MSRADFLQKGWAAFPPDAAMSAWAEAARPVAQACLDDPEQRAQWLRCGGTWFAGVNVFPNDARGAVPGHGVPPLAGAAVDFACDGLPAFDWDPAQVSVCFPGYPQPWEGETDAAFRYRLNRDAAHVDGLRRSGPDRRRTPGEVHGFILGIPLTEAAPDAAPFVVWEGSHEIMRRAFRARLAGVKPSDWMEEDVTDAYWAARREAFETCPRVPLTAPPGGAYVVHRLALHGVAPWGEEGGVTPRMIAYFRPDPFPGESPEWWLDLA